MAAGAASAQEISPKGSLAFNVGIGFPNLVGIGTTTVPPISISGEYTILSDLINNNNGAVSVGGYMGFAASKDSRTSAAGDYGWRHNNFLLGTRGSFHYQFVDNLDTYAGMLIGYNIESVKGFGQVTGSSANGGGFLWGMFIGARYFFNDSFGVFTELGYGVAFINLGVTFKM